MSSMRYRLGLDLGSNTLGWAIFALNDKNEPSRLADGGVLVFPDGRQNEKGKKRPLNESRRMKRGQRKRIRARKWRLKQLASILDKFGCMPSATDKCPYVLRSDALKRPLEKSELARVLLHMAKHRGFESNAISEGKEGKNELGLWEQRDRDLRAAMAANGSLTVGAFMASVLAVGQPVRARFGLTDVVPPTRDLIREEFATIRKAQEPNGVLPESVWQEIARLVHDQRPLKTPEAGLCEFEWKAKERRAYAALPTSALIRIRQDLCHLRLNGYDADGVVLEDTPLNQIQFAALESLLRVRDRVTWDQFRKALDLPNVTFNLETQLGRARKALKGDPSSHALSGKKAFSKTWESMDGDAVVAFLIENRRDPDAIRAKAVAVIADGGWGLLPEAAEECVRIARTALSSFRANLSLKAMKNILPHLVSGTNFYAARKAAGYVDNAQTASLRRRLPYYGELLRGSVAGGTGKNTDSPEKRLGRIPNVTVHVAMNKLRRLINALIEVYGPPQQVSVELLRDLSAGAERRLELIYNAKEREKDNDSIDSEIRAALGSIPIDKGEARRRWRLWKEQEERCIYTGRNIEASEVFSDCEIDHLLPRSRGGFERTDNEVLCFGRINKWKGDRTPHQAFFENTNPEVDWASLAERVRRVYANWPGKRRRFGADAAGYEDDGKGFLPRQFNDASYAARLALAYIRHVCSDVWATRGQLTSSLRRMWGLPKDRNDERNHYIDAVVVAMTDRARVQLYSRLHALGRRAEEKERLPWPSFRDEVMDRYGKIVPVRDAERNPSGALHNETLYSLWRKADGGRYERYPLPPIDKRRPLPIDKSLPADADKEIWRWGCREKISDLFPENKITDESAEAALAKTIDPGFAKRVRTIMARDGVGIADACRMHLEERAAGGCKIRSVECFSDTTDRPLKKLIAVPRGTELGAHRAVVRPDSNHCMVIYEVDGEWHGYVQRIFEAARNDLSGLPANARIVARLHSDDLMELEPGQKAQCGRSFWRVRSIVSDGRIRLWPSALSRAASTEAQKYFGFSGRDGWAISSAERLRMRNPKFLRTTSLGRIRGIKS